MKKQLMCILLSVLAVCAYAQGTPEYSEEDWEACRRIGRSVEAPHFFCDCELTAETFSFPIERPITDTVWYTGRLSDIQRGFSAYWFGDCTLTLEVYAFCTSKVPTFSIDVPANRMKELSNEMIEAMLNAMGSTAKELAGSMEPKVRIYPHDGGSGYVYAYPFGEGPLSTCEEPVQMMQYITYVSTQPEQAYKMESKNLPSNGKAFILWKQPERKVQPGEIVLTLDSCTGEEIGRMEMTDTIHVLQPEAEVLKNAKNEGRSVWMQVRHEEGVTGRVIWYFYPKYAAQTDTVRNSTCRGKSLELNFRKYEHDTVFVDTTWVARDTLKLTYAELLFREPKQEHDTVWLEPASIRHGYRYQPTGDIFHEFGEYEVEVVKPNTCTRAILLYIGDINHQSLDKTNADRRAKKRIKDGRLVIEMDENIFDVLGQKIINN